MQSKRKVQALTVFVAVISFCVGLAGVAMATSHSAVVNFFGPKLINGTNHCADQQTYLYTNPDQGYAYTYHQTGPQCGQLTNVQGGYLGARVQVVRASDGTICEATNWSYNSSSSQFWASGVDFHTSQGCPGGAPYYANGRNRFYRSDTDNYVTSNWLDTPNQNLG